MRRHELALKAERGLDEPGDAGRGFEVAEVGLDRADEATPAVGAPFTQRTTELAVASSSSGFQQIAFAGGQTDLADFSVRVGTLPAGLTVAYPGDRPASTLNSGTSLRGGSTDHVGIRFVATGVPPGRYAVPLTISYTAASPITTTGTVTLVVS